MFCAHYFIGHWKLLACVNLANISYNAHDACNCYTCADTVIVVRMHRFMMNDDHVLLCLHVTLSFNSERCERSHDTFKPVKAIAFYLRYGNSLYNRPRLTGDRKIVDLMELNFSPSQVLELYLFCLRFQSISCHQVWETEFTS